MAKKTVPQKDAEAGEGDKATLSAVERLTLVQPVASFTLSDGMTTLRSLVSAFPHRCVQSRVLDVTGIATSGTDGKRRFRLTSFLCPDSNFRFAFPINVVATPLGNTPHFLTLVHTLVNNAADVEIEVSTWDAGGAPAPNVVFDWQCRVEIGNPIL